MGAHQLPALLTRLLRKIRTEIRIALLGYQPGDPLRCETCGHKLDTPYWANGLPFCDMACFERHPNSLLCPSSLLWA